MKLFKRRSPTDIEQELFNALYKAERQMGSIADGLNLGGDRSQIMDYAYKANSGLMKTRQKYDARPYPHFIIQSKD